MTTHPSVIRRRDSSISAVIFDFDGVVARMNRAAVLRAAKAYKHYFVVSPKTLISEYFHRHPANVSLDLGLCTIDQVREAMRPHVWRGDSCAWRKWWSDVETSYETTETMRSWLLELRGRDYRVGLLSDNHLAFRSWIRRLALTRYFDAILCSAEVGAKKPDARVMGAMCAALGSCASTTVYIDNDLDNVRTIGKRGTPSIHFRSTEQARREFRRIVLTTCKQSVKGRW